MLGEQFINMKIVHLLWIDVPDELITQDTVCDPTLYSNVYYVPSLSDIMDCRTFYGTPDLPLALLHFTMFLFYVL